MIHMFKIRSENFIFFTDILGLFEVVRKHICKNSDLKIAMYGPVVALLERAGKQDQIYCWIDDSSGGGISYNLGRPALNKYCSKLENLDFFHAVKSEIFG